MRASHARPPGRTARVEPLVFARIAGIALAALLAVVSPAARPLDAQSAPGRADSIVAPPFVITYWPGQERLARRTRTRLASATALPGLPANVLRGGAPVRIQLAPDEPRFDSLTGGRAPEWGAGVAFPAAGTIVLPAYASDRVGAHELPRVLRHELAHVALHRYLQARRIPRWFDEGYARWAAGEWGWDGAWHLRLAFLMRRTPPLDSLTITWPRAAGDARVAYLLATSAIGYLVERGGGTRGLEIFLRRWRETGSFDSALRRTYGLTPAQFEAVWRRTVKRRYGWAFFLSDLALFWLFATVLLLVLIVIRRRRDRERLERLRATEPPDDPAFWLDDADDDPGPPPARPA